MATMTYRKLDQNGDYVIGLGSGNFYTDSPEAVAQAVITTLKLSQGEWFIDTSAGTPYGSKILGAGTVTEYDSAIQETILGVQGVKSIVSYSSAINLSQRSAEINCTIDTVYGIASLSI